MKRLCIFISSVQREFAEQRSALHNFLQGDPLLHRFFETFLFENAPAADRRADELYLDEVKRCSIYIGLFGNEYGYEDSEGFSPTPQVTLQVTPQVKRLLEGIQGEMSRGDLMAALKLKDRMHFINEYLAPALNAALIEMTIPDKPRSSKQKYRLTQKGKALLDSIKGGDNARI